jgi:hypothetical protein
VTWVHPYGIDVVYSLFSVFGMLVCVFRLEARVYAYMGISDKRKKNANAVPYDAMLMLALYTPNASRKKANPNEMS